MKRTRVEMICDLHDEVGANTHILAIDGVQLQVDLCERSEAQLNRAVGPFLAAARRVRADGRIVRQRSPNGYRKGVPADTTSSAATRTELPMAINTKAARDWWKRHPKDLPTWRANGALPRAVIDAYRQSTEVSFSAAEG